MHRPVMGIVERTGVPERERERNYARDEQAPPAMVSLVSTHPSINTDCFLHSKIHFIIDTVRVSHFHHHHHLLILPL